MLSSKYVLRRGGHVIKRVNEKETYKSPKISMNYRDTLLEPIADAVVSSKSSGKPKPNQRLVRGKSVFNPERLIISSKSGKPKVIMRTPSKLSCGYHCVDGTMTWISDKDLEDYVHTMTYVSIGKLNQKIELFNMKNSIDKRDITKNPQCINCIHRILSDNYSSTEENNLIPYNGCEILSLYRKLLRKFTITQSSDEPHELDMIISMVFGSDRLSLDDQIKVLEGYQSEMVEYVKDTYKLSDFEARDKLWNLQGNDLWNNGWGKFTGKFGFSVSEGNITPYRLISEWIKSVKEFHKLKPLEHSQRCSIYSADLLISLMLCVISEVNGYNMYGYHYEPRNIFRLKDEQNEFCLNAYAMKHMIDWSDGFQSNNFISNLQETYKITSRGMIRKQKKTKNKKRTKKRRKKTK